MAASSRCASSRAARAAPAKPAQPAGDLRAGRVSLLDLGLGRGQQLAGLVLVGHRVGQVSRGLLAAPGHLVQPGGGLVGHPAQGELARRLGRPAGRPVRAEHVTLPGDHPHLRVGPDQILGLA